MNNVQFSDKYLVQIKETQKFADKHAKSPTFSRWLNNFKEIHRFEVIITFLI